MAAYSYQTIVGAGTAPTMTTPTASDTVAPDERGFLRFRNTDAATRTLTIPAGPQHDFAPGTMPDFTWTLAATTGEVWIPCLQEYADQATGIITITCTPAVTNVTSAAIRR
jgi:hypothetical protein